MSAGEKEILLIEDSASDALLIREMLEESGAREYTLVCEGTLWEGLMRLKAGTIEAVLLDLSLPDSQGLDTFTKLSEWAPKLPVIVLTGLDDERVALTAMRNGAQDYLIKSEINAPLLVRSLRYAIERKQAIDRLRQSEEQLLQAQKMEAIGSLASGIAHDFNNELTAILMSSDLLLMERSPTDPDREKIEVIREATWRAASLTQQLLAFGRKQVLQPKVLNLNESVTAASKMLRRIIGEDIELSTDLESDLGHVKVDPNQLSQIIMNLAVNARDAMPQGGKLSIETANVEVDELYASHHAEIQPGPYVMLAVTDTGCGMEPAVLARIFEPFFTTKELGKGTGLGLSTVYGIVKQSEGHIQVYSEPGWGATFKVYFPRVDEPVAAGRGEMPAAASAGGAETVLIVEDEEPVRVAVAKALAINGYTVLEAPHPQEALQLCDSNDKTVDLLITDVVMPEMNGPGLAEQLRARYPKMKVLFISGYPGRALTWHGLAQGDIPLLQKPFDSRKLAAKVREVLDMRSGNPEESPKPGGK